MTLIQRTIFLRWSGFLYRGYQQFRHENSGPPVPRKVDALLGAAMFMRKSVFEECGRWDEDFSFGVEDLELSARVGIKYPLVYIPTIEITHFGRVSSRQNITFVTPNVLIGYVQYFRKTNTSPWGIRAFKALVTLDAPIQLLLKAVEYGWRVLSGKSNKAERTLLVIKGLWHFLRHSSLRFWRA
jgi:hypothetical protein